MELSAESLRPHLLNPGLSGPDTIKLLESIHKNFTTNRKGIDGYVESIDMVSAYTMFYLPTNIPKLSFVLNSINRNHLQEIKKTTIIDIGTGPGTYALGFLDYFKTEFTGSLILLDQSNIMLEQASKLMGHFFPDFKNISFKNDLNTSKIQGDITLFFGNSINELGFEKAMGLIDKLKPKFLFFIEPGTKEFFKTALKIRNEMSKRGHSVLYPCPSLKNICPLDGKDDWCHQVLKTTHDPSIERLSQLLKKDRRSMPFTSHLYYLNEEQVVNPSARLIRIYKETKYAFLWEVCLEQNDDIKTIRFEVMKKFLSKELSKKLKNSSVGINVEFELIKKISETHWRVKIKGI
jgi:hypothetical protein